MNTYTIDKMLVLNLLYKELNVSNEELSEAQEIEEGNGYSDAMESMERKYWEGYTEALEFVLRELGASTEQINDSKVAN